MCTVAWWPVGGFCCSWMQLQLGVDCSCIYSMNVTGSTYIFMSKSLNCFLLNYSELEWMLAQTGAVESDLEESPRKQVHDVMTTSVRNTANHSDSDDDDWNMISYLAHLFFYIISGVSNLQCPRFCLPSLSVLFKKSPIRVADEWFIRKQILSVIWHLYLTSNTFYITSRLCVYQFQNWIMYK